MSTLIVQWANQHDFHTLLKRSEVEDKPVLLDLHSPECSGCRGHDRDIYSDSDVARDIAEHTFPVRVVTTAPDQAATDIINNHIYIWSPTIQLLAPDQTRYHEWNGAPRRTRLSVGYQTVFHDTPGHLTPESFKAQLLVGRGKAALRKKKHGESIRLFDEAITRHSTDRVTVEEATRWRKVARNGGVIESTWDRHRQVTTSPLAIAVERFAQTVATVPDELLMKDWVGKPGAGDWQWYSDCLREVVLQGYQELCDFAVTAERERAKHGPQFNDTYRLLGQHRFAYREFQSLFVGVPDALLDNTPLRSERSIRENLAHVVMAEWWAYRPQILHALDRGRKGLPPQAVPAADTVAQHGEPPGNHESLHELLALYERVHLRNTQDYSGITHDELGIRSAWWELGPVELRFRLQRYIWHPRDHAVSIDKILDASGHRHTANHRFASRLFSGLGTAEAALIGADGFFTDQIDSLAITINQRADEAARLLNQVTDS
ncbi:DinB family protein [Nocardia sp. NBC_01327]|uniref:DinB family protein n=1 Tax=Nocardia sp. NBC_01327 TaxID=2903593 RepID=UPI002E150063|nr:DinB family protein [Nocardia sp. NBC_01327]